MQVNCPKCDTDISDTYQEPEPDVGIGGGWYCDACDLPIGEHEVDHEPLSDDVGMPPTEKTRPLGTPISELSGQPGHKGYAEFVRIAKSWGYD